MLPARQVSWSSPTPGMRGPGSGIAVDDKEVGVSGHRPTPLVRLSGARPAPHSSRHGDRFEEIAADEDSAIHRPAAVPIRGFGGGQPASRAEKGKAERQVPQPPPGKVEGSSAKVL